MVGNITEEDLHQGWERYLIFGKADRVKNAGELHYGNLLSKMSLWWTMQCGADTTIDCVTVLQQMLQSGKYYPSMTWIQPIGGGGLDQERMDVLFKIMKDWTSTTRSDVRMIFMQPDHRYADMHLELAQRFPELPTLRPWQADLVERLQEPITPADRKVNWYHEATGATGKSWLARHLALHHNAVHVQMMKRDDMLHVLARRIKMTTKIVVFDITRTTAVENPLLIYEVLEMLKDGQISSGKYESCVIPVMPMHVVVFSNSAPRVEMMSEDRWNIVEINAHNSSGVLPDSLPLNSPLQERIMRAVDLGAGLDSESEYDSSDTDSDSDIEEEFFDDEPYVEMVRAILRREDDDDMQQLLDAEEDGDYSPAEFETPAANSPSRRTRVQPETPAAMPSRRTRVHRTTPDGFSSP